MNEFEFVAMLDCSLPDERSTSAQADCPGVCHFVEGRASW